MGCGKSTVGAALARRLCARFVDTDHQVAQQAGVSIPEIFADQGEAAFRRLERAAVDRVAGKPVVVALGGGAMAQQGMAEQLAGTGTTVYLRALPETLVERLGAAEERPLLAGLNREQRETRLRELLAEREVHYAAAKVSVDTDARDVEAVVEEIAGRLEDSR